jgi:hypothetical protein
MYVFFSKIIYNINIYVRPYFLSHVVSTIFASDLPVVEFDDYKFKYWFELEIHLKMRGQMLATDCE